MVLKKASSTHTDHADGSFPTLQLFLLGESTHSLFL
jgi:hypothetical protein